MSTKPILIVHPTDKTTSFLDKIKNYLVCNFRSDIHHFNVYPNDESHKQCLEKIKQHNGVVIFLGHGHSEALYGSKGDFWDSSEFVSDAARMEQLSKYYYNSNFINLANIAVFAGKKIFCLACNSNGKIATSAFEHGAKAFLGFGDLPTSKAEFEEQGLININKDVVRLMKAELNYIIKRSLQLAISNNYNFGEIGNLIHFITNQRIAYYLRDNRSFTVRHLLADQLYRMKIDMKIVGDKKLNFV